MAILFSIIEEAGFRSCTSEQYLELLQRSVANHFNLIQVFEELLEASAGGLDNDHLSEFLNCFTCNNG